MIRLLISGISRATFCLALLALAVTVSSSVSSGSKDNDLRQQSHSMTRNEDYKDRQDSLPIKKFAQVKKRIRDNYSPSYEIIGFSSPETISSKIRQLTNSSMDSDFSKNLLDLKKVVKSKSKQLGRTLQSNSELEKGKASKVNGTLEEDINTINVLISMLMLANKKLIDQRNKVAKRVEPRMPGDQELGTIDSLDITNGGQSSLRSTDAPDKPDVRQTRKPKGEKDRKRGKTKLLAINSTVLPDYPLKSDQNPPPSSMKRSRDELGSQQSATDHIMVRPGFDRTDESEDREPYESAPGETIRKRHDIARGPFHPQPTSGLSRMGHHEEFLLNHKPTRAHDLLNVNRHHQNQAHSFIPPENMFVTSPQVDRNPHQIDHSVQQHPVEAVDQPYPRQPLADIALTRDNEILTHRLYPMVPPYNGLSLNWPQTPQQQLSQYPFMQRLGETEMRFNPLKTTAQPLEFLPGNTQRLPAPIKIQENEISHQPNMSPIEQAIEMAKRQQNVELAHEKRRQEYEMELQKRQEQIKKQHEDNLERQRLAHVAAAEKAQQSKKEQEEPKNSGQQVGGEQEKGEAQSNGGQEESDNPAGKEADNGTMNGDGGSDEQEEEQKAEDPEMKNLQNFAGDTDFTDLFPPGILSEAEIKEMRKQQEDQRQRQEQEESDESAKQQPANSNEQEESRSNSASEPETMAQTGPISGEASGERQRDEQTEKGTEIYRNASRKVPNFNHQSSVLSNSDEQSERNETQPRSGAKLRRSSQSQSSPLPVGLANDSDGYLRTLVSSLVASESEQHPDQSGPLVRESLPDE